MNEDTPVHHFPQTQGLHLLNDAIFSEPWTQFFVECCRLATLVRQRRIELPIVVVSTQNDESQTA